MGEQAQALQSGLLASLAQGAASSLRGAPRPACPAPCAAKTQASSGHFLLLSPAPQPPHIELTRVTEPADDGAAPAAAHTRPHGVAGSLRHAQRGDEQAAVGADVHDVVVGAGVQPGRREGAGVCLWWGGMRGSRSGGCWVRVRGSSLRRSGGAERSQAPWCTAPPLPPPSAAPVVQQVGRAVRQQRVALHLPKPDAAAKLAPLDGLPCQRVDGARGAHLGRAAGASRAARENLVTQLHQKQKRPRVPNWALLLHAFLQPCGPWSPALPQPLPAGLTWNLSDTMCRSRW